MKVASQHNKKITKIISILFFGDLFEYRKVVCRKAVSC